MKVVAFNTSPRVGSNTSIMLQTALKPLQEKGFETELIEMGTHQLSGCIACYKCKERKDLKCAINSDKLNEYVQKMIEADAILLGSPTYFSTITSNMKSLMDRAGMVTRCNGNLLNRKVGAAVAVARRAGAMNVFTTVNQFFYISGMIVPGSDYWNVGYAGPSGAINEEAEALKTMSTLGENVGWLLEKLHK